MNLRSVDELQDLAGKSVLVRVDFDVPLERVNGQYLVEDDHRLRLNLTTLEYLVRGRARVVLAGQVDRPGGRFDLSKSTQPIANYYRQYFPSLEWIDDCRGPAVEDRIRHLGPGQVLVLENLRFYPGEENNDLDFARALARLADFYVNENFSNSHRDHASMTTLASLLPAFAGFNLVKEIKWLSKVVEEPRRPLMVVIGGSKSETKLPAVKNLLNLVDRIFVGGAVGCHGEVLAPLGKKVAFACGDPDLSFNTAKSWAVALSPARTIIWNGPMGDTTKNQVAGTEIIAQGIVEATRKGALSVVGGGDTENFLRKIGFEKGVSFISSGGGAMLDFLGGVELPALKPLLS